MFPSHRLPLSSLGSGPMSIISIKYNPRIPSVSLAVPFSIMTISNHGVPIPGVDVHEALLDHARAIQELTTRLDQIQSIRTPVVTSVQTGWFRDFAFYSLVLELNKPLGSLCRRATLPGPSKTTRRQQPFYGLLRTLVSVTIPCPYAVFCEIAKSHHTLAHSKSYDNPEYFPNYDSFLLPCNHKNRYVLGFNSFFAVCAALSQLDSTITSTFLVRQHPSSHISRVLGTLARNPSDSDAPLRITPGYSWDGVLPYDPLGQEDPDDIYYRVSTLELASTVVNPDTLLFRHRLKSGSWHVSNTAPGDITKEDFKYNTFFMEWIPPIPLPRGLAHLPVKNKADLGILQINLPAVAIATPELRVEVDSLLTSSIVNHIASTSSQ